MAATDELTEDLDLARRALDDLHDEIGRVGLWNPLASGRWQLRFELSPRALDPGGPVPSTTVWHAIVDAEYPAGVVDIFPDKDAGITETFAHQLPNDDGPADIPWRTGKVCLVDTVRGHELAAARDEPSTAYERLVWHVWRTIGWLERASRNELLMEGEPFELPVFGQFEDGATVAFTEGPETFADWQARTQTLGLADLVLVADDRGRRTVAVTNWRTLKGRQLIRPLWGRRIAATKAPQTALWFRFGRLLVRPPWRAPQTWQEVEDSAAEQGVDFGAVLREGAAAIRDDKPHYVLLGFPVPRVMGEAPSRYAWVAFQLPAISRDRPARTAVPGFRPHVAAWLADRRNGALADDVPLGWVRSENWHPDELAARGRFEGGLAQRRIALLGAGALGSAMADLLVRGGVRDLAIFDGGKLEAGNLARHQLSMLELGQNKADALALRLNTISPNARVVGYASAFPPSEDAARAALDKAEIVIDTTALERVAQGLGDYAWVGACLFASVSVSFGAEKLYLYLATGSSFPSADFSARLRPWIDADARPAEDFPHEGTGCWSSVFPARADDIVILAAIGARQVDQRFGARIEKPELFVYGRQPDGTVALIDQPARPA